MRNYGKNKVYSARKASTLRKDNSKTKVLQQAMDAIPNLQGGSEDFLFTGNFEIKIKIHSTSKADIDNITKAILDSLQGSAYGNDRNCRKMAVEFC